MRINRNILAFRFLLFFSTTQLYGNDIINKYVDRIQLQVDRIDQIDGELDRFIGLKSELQSAQAAETYIKSPKNIVARSMADKRFKDYIPPNRNLGAVLIKTYHNML